MLADWPDAGRIDSGRIGLFGFSVGGYTGLVVIGGNPDFRKGHPRCARTDLRALPVCSQLENGELPREAPAHDPRIKAAVIIDPWPAFLLPADHLSAVTIPIQLWSSDPMHQSDGVSGCCAATIRTGIQARMAFRRECEPLRIPRGLLPETGAGRPQDLRRAARLRSHGLPQGI